MNTKKILKIVDLTLPLWGLAVVILYAINGWWIVMGIWILITLFWTLTSIDKIKYEKERKEMDKEWEEIMNLPDRGAKKSE